MLNVINEYNANKNAQQEGPKFSLGESMVMVDDTNEVEQQINKEDDDF